MRVDPDAVNGLAKPSAVDVLQLRGLDTQRFVHRIGEVSADKMEEIVLTIVAVVEYP